MSKDSQVTNTIAESIQYDFVSGPQMRPIVRTQYEINGTFADIAQDLTSRTISQKNENDQYQVYSFMPPVSNMSIQMNNYNQKYAEGNTASDFEGVFKKNQLIRCWSGYEMTADVGTGTVTDDFSTRTKYVHTQLTGGAIVPDISSYSGTIGAYASLGATYDSETYDDSFYAYPGYYKKKFKLPLTIPVAKKLRVTTTSNKFDLKYRVSPKESMLGSGWSDYTPLSTGSNEITLTSFPDEEWVEAVVRFNNEAWGTADQITAFNCGYGYRGQLFKVGTFVLDEPVLSGANLSLKGRDYLKKALETEINLPAITDDSVTNVVSKVLDRCSIPYDTATWDNISTLVNLSSSGSEAIGGDSAWKVLDKLMDAVNAGDNDIRFRFDATGNAQIKKIPTDVEADWVAHYFYNTEKSSKSKESDKQIQRITVLQKNFNTSPELTLGTFSGTLSGAVSATFAMPTVANYKADGNWTSGTGTSVDNDFLYVRYIDNNSTYGKIDSELDRTNNSLRLSFTGATGSDYPYNFTVLGVAPKVKDVNVWAERGNANNILKNEGSTYKRINEFLNATTGKAFADYYIDLAGEPKDALQLDMAANPLLELNDNIMNISQWLFDDTIYGLTEINESWKEPGLRHSLKLRDRGFNIEAFVYDRDTYGHWDKSTINTLQYDIGLIWDQYTSPNSTGDGNVDIEYEREKIA